MLKRHCCRRKRRRGRRRPVHDALSPFAEDLEKTLLPIAEDAFDVGADKEPVHQRAAARMVTDVVTAERAAIALGEGVGVVPQVVGPGKLLIDELMRRFPDDDLGSPADGDAVNLDAVIDEQAGTHDDGRGCQDFKLQPGRREFLEIARLAEEGKNFVARAWQPKLSVEEEFFHYGLSIVQLTGFRQLNFIQDEAVGDALAGNLLILTWAG